MASVTLDCVSKLYGRHAAVDQISLSIEEGEFLVLLGPSGCGKTTTLRMIAGLVEPTSGVIQIGGRDVTSLPARKRNIGMVFQDYALFPHMTIADNIAFGLRERRVEAHSAKKRVAELLSLVQLPNFEQRFPSQLSGGQQQRVALARALAYSPAVLLMDEPLGALDLKLRQAMQIELRRVQRTLGITTIFVTHDQEEAMSLADRIVVMREGRIEQAGTPEDLYQRPASSFVANFVGTINFLPGIVESVSGTACRVALTNGIVVEASTLTELSATRVRIAVRPENVILAPDHPGAGGEPLAGTVEQRRFLGNVVHYSLRISSGELLLVEHSSAAATLKIGDRVSLSWRAEHAHAFADLDGDG
jgi:spermidine/putrescine transport system ATP-binding protein